MSFLNPVNEPVLRFSSTDADAPQIDYAARTAGDIKAVLKACLVTGYGTKASAGWSVVDEVDHVAEFVSPSISMIDYKIGIDDGSASTAQWYYKHQDVRTNPTNSSLSKNYSSVDLNNASNGWELVVTKRAFYYMEFLYSTVLKDLFARVVFFGQAKSALSDSSDINIGFWVTGLNFSGSTPPSVLFEPRSTSHKFFRVSNYKDIWFGGANNSVITSTSPIFQPESVVTDIISAQYLYDGSVFVGEQVGMLTIVPCQSTGTHGVRQMEINGRPLLFVCLGYMNGAANFTNNYTRSMLIRLDYWEF